MYVVLCSVCDLIMFYAVRYSLTMVVCMFYAFCLWRVVCVAECAIM